MLRMAAKMGLLADISGVSRARSRRKALLSRLYSPEKVASGISRRSASRSSPLRRMRRPLPRPWYGSEVRAGQAITMFSPRPCCWRAISFCRPSPNATSSDTDTVPQVMPSSVSSVRTFWCCTSCRICFRKESEVTPASALRRGQAQGRHSPFLERHTPHTPVAELERQEGAERAHHAITRGGHGHEQEG